MGNVFRILARDFKRLLKAPAALVVVGALLVLPSLYTWYNVLAFWNPYEATGSLSVGVVNQDAGADTDMTGPLNVGEAIIEELAQNDQLNWVVQDYDQAMDDLQVGDVYAVYVIPEDFSECLVSPLTGEVKAPQIRYFANEKLGPVSPKITDAAASALDQKINSMFVQTVTDAAAKAVDEAAEKAKADIAESESQAEDRAAQARAAISEVRDTLSGVQAGIEDARGKVADANGAIDSASAMAGDAQAVLQDITNETEALQSSLSDLSTRTVPVLSGVLKQVAQVSAEAGEVADSLASAAGTAQTDVDIAIARIQPIVDALNEASGDLQTISDSLPDILADLKTAFADASIDAANKATELQTALNGASGLSERIAGVSQQASESVGELNGKVQQVSDSVSQMTDELYGNAASTLDSTVAQVAAACARLSAGVSNLDAAAQQARPALSQLDAILADSGSAISETDALIATMQGDLDSLMADAHLLANSSTIANLLENGTLNAQNISEFMGSPTKLETHELYAMNAYGTSMAPLFMNLSFWIGAFMLVIIFRLEVDSEGIAGLKPWQRYLGRFSMFGIYVTLQAIICCVGTLALGVEVASIPAFFAASIVSALAFLGIIFALSATFKHVGKALCVVLVFAQIPGGSGLYPMELTSSFYQDIAPLLPFTYGVDALREAIAGFYDSYFATDLAVLAVFFVVSLILGLALGPVMSNIVRMTARQVREGDLYNGEEVETPARPYRLAQVLRALTDKEEYRAELEEKYEVVKRRYPLFIRGSIVVGAGVPVILGFLLALDAAEKVTLLTLLLVWFIVLIAFLVAMESQRYSLERQLDLEHLSDTHLLNLFSARDRMVRSGIRLTRHGAAVYDALEDRDAHTAIGRHVRQKARSGAGNIIRIVQRDFQGLFKNVMSTIITIGLVLLPSLFAWYNILACWDVFENTGNLSVAVASEDAGYTSDLMPIEVNVGDKVVSALRENDQINWVFTNPEDAIEGTRSGKYYAALVIPENFSTQMLTFYEGDAASASIDYYVNMKKNAIAPNITGTGADTVSYEVNTTFAKTISEVAVGLAQSLSNVAEEDDAEGKISSLASHMRMLASRIDESADVLGLYSSIAADSSRLVQEGVDAVNAADERARTAASDIDAAKARIRELAGNLGGALDGLDAGLQNARQAAADLNTDVEAWLSNATNDANEAASALWNKAAEIDAKVTELDALRTNLDGLRTELHEGLNRQVGTEIDDENVEGEISLEVEITAEDTLLLDKAIAELDKGIEILQNASAKCSEAAEALANGSNDAWAKLETLQQLVAQALADMDNAKADLDENLRPGFDQLRADIESLANRLDEGASSLGGLGDLANAMGVAAGALNDTSGKIGEADGKLRTASQGVRDLADAVDAAIASGDTQRLRELLQGSAGDLAAALTAPVQVERVALYPSENFGSAMTPLYCALALFIGSLLIMVAMKPEVSPRGREELSDPKPRHLYFGRFAAVAAVSLMQTTLLGLGTMFFLKVQVAEPLLFMLTCWVSGLVFAFIIYTMVVSFGNLGKAIAVLLLIIQVTACGGSYPLQILPDFVQALSQWVPAYYIVEAMRAAMMGVYMNDFWVAMGYLLLFVIPFLLLGLVLRKPTMGFMKWYIGKVEECKIME